MDTTLVTPELLLTILSGGVVSALGGYFKEKFPKIDTQVLVTGAALVIGTAYTLFTLLTPVEAQKAILNYIWTSLASAVLIYEWVWKNFGKKKKNDNV